MRNRRHVPLAAFLVSGFAITALAQDPSRTAPAPARQQQVQALIQSGANAVEVGDSTQARVVYDQLLEIGRQDRRLDLVWQAQHGLGRAALAAHDPLTAIDHLDQSVAAYEQLRATSPTASPRSGETPQRSGPYHTLATALMMQSSSPVDQFVERGFEAAARARANRPDVRSRADLAAALGAGDVVIAFLVGDSHAYAWAFDRDTLIGYPLPPPAEIAAAVERANAYVAHADGAGVQRLAEDLMPALLGPVLDRIPAPTRVIFVMDGPLRQLSIGELPTGAGESNLSRRLAVSTVDDGALFDEIGRPPSKRQPPQSAWPMTTLLAGAIVAGILLVAGVAALRRRSSIAERDADRARGLDQI
jgi:hypothetical protein